jgi:hypothetical protein
MSAPITLGRGKAAALEQAKAALAQTASAWGADHPATHLGAQFVARLEFDSAGELLKQKSTMSAAKGGL